MKKSVLERNEWVLDVTLSYPCFCPYDSKSGDIITGINHIGACPGKCVGVVHLDGEDELNKCEWNRPMYFFFRLCL